ncbi:RNA exonuclease 1 [Dendrobium catenatum]|uniref:RNA exonuclease 1 n=1 Tax=Dendrobium catenatum TaxID=906689 RepID=A0A2I0WAL3_9ASPA|nr:RNA exonuclease 1 [Dendrobium catenatum]
MTGTRLKSEEREGPQKKEDFEGFWVPKLEMEEGGRSSMDDRNTKSFLSTATPIMLDSKGRFSFKRISPHNFWDLESPLVIKEGGLIAKHKPLLESGKGKDVISVLDKIPKSPLSVIISGANDNEASSSGISFIDILKNDKGIDNGNVNIKNPIISSRLDNSNVWIKKPHIKINLSNIHDDIEDANVVKLDMEKEKSNIQVLSNSLVVKILGKNLPFSKCAIEVRKQWMKYGGFHITLLGLDWLLCSFQSHEAMEEVLNGGPWFIGGFVVGLDKWSPNFSPNSLDGVSCPIWVRLPHLPLHCWDESNITRIASRIGTPLLLDGNMFRWGRREFAKAYIRVNLNSKLPSGIWVEGLHGRFIQKFEYENLSSLRFKCGRI